MRFLLFELIILRMGTDGLASQTALVLRGGHNILHYIGVLKILRQGVGNRVMVTLRLDVCVAKC